MREVCPAVYVVARTGLDFAAVGGYLEAAGGGEWAEQFEEGIPNHGEVLAEFAGRLCYRSWAPGLNPNVRRVRTDHEEYLRNILAQQHGSVLEHVTYSFAFRDVSRVFTHELVRHRAGTAVSQESMRFVRLDDLPFWFPDWALQDKELLDQAVPVLARLEWFQNWMATHFGLDTEGVPFAEKKAKTSFMRRFAPEGVATTILWTANLRTIRHVIETRTAAGAEEEIRLVFGRVARIMKTELPAIFGDFSLNSATGAWETGYRKV